MNTETWVVEYDSNNSGGGWWLTDADWRTLETEGWTVEWLGANFCNSRYPTLGGRGRPAPNIHDVDECPGHRGADSYDEAVAADPDGRWLGSLARSATIEVEAYTSTLAEGVAETWWENALGKNASEEGCNCCGRPHSFYARALRSGEPP